LNARNLTIASQFEQISQHCFALLRPFTSKLPISIPNAPSDFYEGVVVARLVEFLLKNNGKKKNLKRNKILKF